MAFGLEYPAVFNAAKLADSAIDGTQVITWGLRTCFGPQWPCEEFVEGRVAADVGLHRFLHVDAVMPDETANYPGGKAAGARTGELSGEYGNELFRQQILMEDGETVKHAGHLDIRIENYSV